MNTPKKILALAGLVALAGSTMAYVTFSGNPRWPLSGSFHYVADLYPNSFPTTTAAGWYWQARKSLADWYTGSSGGTSYNPGFRYTATDYTNHSNGVSTWAWQNQPTQSWLGVTFVRWSGATMTDCDIHYNSRADYPWTYLRTDPCPAQATTPYSFRGVAIHEHGHALGLDHESDVINTMQPVYSTGTMVMHVDSDAESTDFGYNGMLPHADDKAGVRFLYPSSAAAYNLMATNWAWGPIAQKRLSGTFQAGTGITLPGVTLENMSNRVVTGNAAGVRVGIYLSTNSIISASDTLINYYTFSGDWPAHATGHYTTLGGTIPVATTAGTYYVGAIFDNTDLVAEGPRANFDTTSGYGADNACQCGQITVTAAPFPDLTPTVLGASSTNFRRGDTITASSTIRNQGTAASAACTSGYYLSLDSTITTADTLLLSFTTNALAINGTHNHSAPVSVPLNTPIGPCWLGVIADRLSTVGEGTNEGNNTRALAVSCQAGIPDLEIMALSLVSAAPIQAGTVEQVSVTTRNIGNDVCAASATGLFLSADTTITTTDTFLGAVPVPALAVSATSTVTANVAISYCQRSGTCYVGAIADYQSLITELSEANNTRAAGPYACAAITGTGRWLQYQNLLGTAAIANNDARFFLANGPRTARMCVAAPALPNHWYLLVWSGSSGAFVYDSWSGFSLSLLNGPIMPNWINRLDASGYSALPAINLPAVKLAGVLVTYTHSVYFTPTLSAIVGFGSNTIRDVINP